MRKIQPSERISKEISEILENGYKGNENLMDVFIKKSIKNMIQ